MNLGRRRNVFTLGDFHAKLQANSSGQQEQQRRRPRAEIFERDPFKVHSYNFRYADRPVYPLQQPPAPSPASSKPFNTVFYNYDFANNRPSKENSAAGPTFHEHRRRKFLHDFQAAATPFQHGANIGAAAGAAAAAAAVACSSSSAQQQHHQPYQQHPYSGAGGSATMYASSYNYNASGNGISGCGAHTPAATAAAAAAAAVAAHGGARPHGGGQRGGGTQSRERLPGLYAISSPSACSGGGGGGAGPGAGGVGGGGASASSRTSLDSSTAGALRGRSPGGWRLPADHGPGNGFGHYAGLRSDTPSRAAGAGRGAQQYGGCGGGGCYGHSGVLPNGSGGGGAALRQQRRSLPSVHAPAQPMVNALSSPPLLERKLSNTSGCRININIQSGSEPQNHAHAGAADNVTIQIGKDNSNNRGARTVSSLKDAAIYSGNQRVPLRLTSPGSENDFNLLNRTGSTDTIIIDKYISKFAVNRGPRAAREREPSRSPQRAASPAPPPFRSQKKRIRAAEPLRLEPSKAKVKSRRPNDDDDTDAVTPPSRRLQQHQQEHDMQERLPSLVPWRLDNTLRECFQKAGPTDKAYRPTNNFRRIRASYNSCVHDLQALREFNDAQDASMHRLRDAAATLSPERKLLNTVTSLQQQLRDCAPRQRANASRHTICAGRENPRVLAAQHAAPRHLHAAPCTRSEMGLRRTAAATALPTGAESSSGSRRASPVRVNINVFTDKLKLLRM